MGFICKSATMTFRPFVYMNNEYAAAKFKYAAAYCQYVELFEVKRPGVSVKTLRRFGFGMTEF